jgi:hypothetical protein
MTKSVILKPLMTTFFIAAIVLFAIRSFHRFIMRAVESYEYTSPAPKEEPQYETYSYLGTHTDFKRRSKV